MDSTFFFGAQFLLAMAAWPCGFLSSRAKFSDFCSANECIIYFLNQSDGDDGGDGGEATMVAMAHQTPKKLMVTIEIYSSAFVNLVILLCPRISKETKSNLFRFFFLVYFQVCTIRSRWKFACAICACVSYKNCVSRTQHTTAMSLTWNALGERKLKKKKIEETNVRVSITQDWNRVVRQLQRHCNKTNKNSSKSNAETAIVIRFESQK